MDFLTKSGSVVDFVKGTVEFRRLQLEMNTNFNVWTVNTWDFHGLDHWWVETTPICPHHVIRTARQHCLSSSPCFSEH